MGDYTSPRMGQSSERRGRNCRSSQRLGPEWLLLLPYSVGHSSHRPPQSRRWRNIFYFSMGRVSRICSSLGSATTFPLAKINLDCPHRTLNVSFLMSLALSLGSHNSKLSLDIDEAVLLLFFKCTSFCFEDL